MRALLLVLLYATGAWAQGKTSFVQLPYTDNATTNQAFDRIDACFSGIHGYPGAPPQCTATGGGGGAPGGSANNLQINNGAGGFAAWLGASCPGQAIQSLNASGTPVCVAAGTGTVTNTGASLPANQLLVGNTSPDIKAAPTASCGGTPTQTCGTLDTAGNLTVSTLTVEDQNTGGKNALRLFGNTGATGVTCAAAGHAKQLTLLDISNSATDTSRIWEMCNATLDTGFSIRNQGFAVGAGTPQIASQGTSGVIADINITPTPTLNHCVQFDANGNLQDAGAACGTGTGAGTVTNVPGPLTASQLMVGNNGNDSRVRATNACGGAGTGNCGQLTATGDLTGNTYNALDQNTGGANFFQLLGNAGMGTAPTCANTGLGKSLTLLDVSNQGTDSARAWSVCNSNTDTGFQFLNQGIKLGGSVAQTGIVGTSGTLIDQSGPSTPGDCARYDASGNLTDGVCAGTTLGFDKITGGTNQSPPGAAMIVGPGSSLAPSFSGVITANQLTCSGCVQNAALANQYSGVGTCSTGFVRVLNGNGVPTCAPVNLSSDVTGFLSSKNIGDPVHIDAIVPTIDCTGRTDATALFQNALNTLAGGAPAGASVWLPSGCILRFASPGAGNVSIHIPNNIQLICEDLSAGFAVNRQFCQGGTYPGAACATSAECLGGGTCITDFGTSSVPYATTAGQTYTLFQDNANSSDIVIQNCSFFLAQAEPYQRCSGGTGGNVGDPCRQECAVGSTGNGSGARCTTDADCGGGVGSCLNRADCAATGSGNACSGTPHLPSGPGNINVLDFTRTIGVKLFNVSMYDHFQGAFAVSTGNFATIQNTNTARELTDCTTPFPVGSGAGKTPTDSQCLTPGINNGFCCYGALNSNSTNQQPGNLVSNDIIVGTDSQVQFVKARGLLTGITAGARSRIDESSILPYGTGTGPGQPGGGMAVGQLGVVAKSYVLYYGAPSGYPAINVGPDGSAVEDRIQFASGTSNATGIQLTGADAHAVLNNVKGFGNNEIGIEAQGNYDEIRGNYIEGSAGTGEAVHICASGCGIGGVAPSNVTVAGNFLVSSPVNQLATGVLIEGPSADIASNQIASMLNQSIWVKGGPSGTRIVDNTSSLGNLTFIYSLLPTFHPDHILSDAATIQMTIANNIFNSGWRGYTCGTANGGLTNTGISGNRFVNMGGPPTACGGAGLQLIGNYVNNGASTYPLICDASCSGGNGAGNICRFDSDCTSCGASVNKCVPQAAFGYLGSPNVNAGNGGSAHNLYFGNILFDGSGAFKQCGGSATNLGQLCNTTGATCANGAAACVANAAGVFACNAGVDANQPCCNNAAATCAVRDQAPMLRVVDSGVAATHSDFNFIGNQVFGNSATLTSVTFLDMMSPGNVSLGHTTITTASVASNTIDLTAVSGTQGIRFPTVNPGQITKFSILNNNFQGTASPASTNLLVNYQGAFGSLSLQNGRLAHGSLPVMGTGTTGIFFPFDGMPSGATLPPTARTAQVEVMPGAGTVWKMACQVDAAPATTATRVFTLEKAGSTTPMTCTIASGSTSCATTAGAASAPISFTAGQTLDYTETATVGPAAANGSCVAYVSYDSGTVM